ncbi:conserved hypothetical protein [Beutenbergia cavernae DSM 12333]|uniref:DinB-like domain-containing protein n=1 Tax=Beutenbergia cavernae (strain ATCC BAA-8 / DSM 12333 / CCUG 43141 / JCM 11478 / NBRC 16432 / NCIMB 13614 / HKI 0122) TaxID=471853 RepID=C5C6G1_BEUC1|nr:DinB family protein [Beutenbergia cavernae]ACQ80367.1 conserved hypothetical protein [Beutenbergia cavernae DSM 12333]
MQATDVLTDCFVRIHGVVTSVLDDAGPDLLTWRAGPTANTPAWLVWHATRVIDAQVSDAVGHPECWTQDGWATRFDLPFPASATGYGFTPDDVARVRVGAAELRGYADAVHATTLADLAGLAEGDLDRVVDTAWDPPVTLGVRLVSTVADAFQHAGQAAYVRGLWRAASAA